MFTYNQKHTVIALMILLGVWYAHCATAADAVTLELAAGDYDRECTVVSVELPESMQDSRHFTLTRLDTGKTLPVQVDRTAEKPRITWIIGDKLESGKTRKYRLAPTTDKPSEKDGVTVSDDGKHLLVKVGEKSVLAYNHAVAPSPDPKQPCYARSGYIHPVYNPAGQVVTDDFHPDHSHQHGIMFAWRKTTFEGRHTNGWDQKAGTGKVEHVKVESLGGGPVFGHFTVRLRQLDLTAPDGPKPVLDETWYVRTYNFSEQFVFDIESTQRCAGQSRLVVDKMHYGGLMIRGHADWHKRRNYDFLTDQGKTKTDGNQSRPRWVDMYGPIDGRPTGIVIMDCPENIRFPQPVRLHPWMPYFCFTPATLGSFTIEPGKPYISRYRFCVYDGKLGQKAAECLWQDYARPPTVRIVERAVGSE